MRDTSTTNRPLPLSAPFTRWDFGKFFVMKESLALMYKELQLPSEALLKYQVGHDTPTRHAYLLSGRHGSSTTCCPCIGRYVL